MLIDRDMQTVVLEGYGGKNGPTRSAVSFTATAVLAQDWK